MTPAPQPVGPPPLVRERIAGIVFDLDGTLIDSYAAITDSVNAARAHFGLEAVAVAEVKRHVGRGLECLLADLVGPDRIEDGVRLFRARYAEVYAGGTVLLPGVAEGLALLERHGIAMAVASNKPAAFSRPILAGFGLERALPSVHGPDTVGATKPDPAMVLRCLADLGVTADRALYVGDMLLDIETASRASVPVALVDSGSASRSQLLASGQRVVEGVDALAAWLVGGG